MPEKDDEYVSYSEAVKKMKEQQNREDALFTEDELRALDSARSTTKSRVEKRLADKKVSKKENQPALKQGVIVWVVAGLAWGMYLALDSLDIDKKETTAPIYVERTPSQTRQDKIDSQFSSWDDSHRDLVRRIKRQMHDPSSFDHVKTNYTEKDGHLMIVMSYRGNNGFGAKILSSAIAFYTIEGQFIGELSE